MRKSASSRLAKQYAGRGRRSAHLRNHRTAHGQRRRSAFRPSGSGAWAGHRRHYEGDLDRGIAPDQLTSVEYSSDFYHQLLVNFPGVNFVNGDAFDLKRSLGAQANQTFDCVISAVPLLNFPCIAAYR